jgi:hypothetical protein
MSVMSQKGHTIWLFSASVKGVQASANLYSLIEELLSNLVFSQMNQAAT